MLSNRLVPFLRKHLFEGEVLKLMSLTIITKPIGLATQMLLASAFGAGLSYDSYVLSFFLVNFLSNTMSRVFTAVIVPFVIARKKIMTPGELDAFLNGILLVALVPMFVFAGVALTWPQAIVKLGAPKAPAETAVLAAKLLRVMAVPAVLMLSVDLLKPVLNLNGRFRIPTSLPIVNSLTTFLILLTTHAKLGIWALPVAYCVSQGTQLIIASTAARRYRILRLVRPAFPRELLARLWQQGWMSLLATVILVTNLFVDKIFASSMEVGSVSSITYSRSIEAFGMQIFSFSLVSVMFTRTAGFIADGDLGRCNDYIRTNLVRLYRLAIPVCLGVAVASREVVFVLFQRNAFTEADTVRTAGVMAMYLLGLPAFLSNNVIANVFHALGKYRDKIWLALQFILTNIGGNLLLMGPLKVMGLAVSSSVAINLHLLLSFLFLSRYDNGLQGKKYFGLLLKHYIFGLLTWILYRELEVLVGLPTIDPGTTKLMAMGLGALKFICIVGIFGAVMLGNKLLTRVRNR